jgi:cysteinyl-tRNA synthetase
MELKLYDTLTRQKRPFEPLDRARVRAYVCGPTVYDFAHIGNARPVIVFDVLFRLLRHLYGADHVTYVRNITDVDDKINARAAQEYPDRPLNEAIRTVTATTERQFHEDVDALGCLRPTVEPRATEHIDAMKALIERLVAEGHAYVAQEHVLFSMPSMPDYGRLSKRSLDEMIAGARVDVAPYKRDPMDFVLWKPSKAGEPAWPSPVGIATPGRPGWHIECSAMSWKHLGEVFDIHGGGIDLVFPHHENEIAQTRCAFHSPVMANYWMHNGFLQVEGRKMAKSEGNFITIHELLKTKKFGGRSWSGDVLRFAMLQTQYRQPIDWTIQSVEQSEARLSRWKEFASEQTQYKRNPDLYDEVMTTLCDDLNTPSAFAIIDRIVNSERPNDKDRYTVFKLLKDLGFKGGLSNVSQLAKNLTSVLNGMSRLSPNDWKNVTTSVQQRPTLISGKIKSGTKLIASISVTRKLLDQLAPVLAPAAQSSFVCELEQSIFVRVTPQHDEFEKRIDATIGKRNAARKARNFAEADGICDELAGKGNISHLAKNLTSVLNKMSRLSPNDWKNVTSSVQQRPTSISGKIKPGTKLIASISVARKLLDQLVPVLAPAAQSSFVCELEQNIFARVTPQQDEFENRIDALIEKRNAARKARDFAEADRIRDELADKGIVLRDSKEGTTWEVAR